MTTLMKKGQISQDDPKAQSLLSRCVFARHGARKPSGSYHGLGQVVLSSAGVSERCLIVVVGRMRWMFWGASSYGHGVIHFASMPAILAKRAYFLFV